MVNDQGVKVRDQGTNREYFLKIGRQRLRPGEYKIDVKETPAGVEFSADSFSLKRGDKVAVTVRFNPQKDPKYLREDALGWFPADATFFGAANMQAFPELWQVELLIIGENSGLRNNWATPKGDRFLRFLSLIGQVDRLAAAYKTSRQPTERSFEFIRFTGNIAHSRLVDFFRREWSDLTIEQTQAKGEPITLIYDSTPRSKFGTSLALIGNTDLILAGHHHGRGEGHLEGLRQCLELRAGRGISLSMAQAKTLEEFPVDATSLWAGEIPAYLKRQGPAIFTLARSVVSSWSGTSSSDVEIRFRGSFDSVVAATAFKTTLNVMKRVFTAAPDVLQNPELSAAVAEAFRSLRVESDADRITVNVKIPAVAVAALVKKLQDMPLEDVVTMKGLLPVKKQ